METQGGDVRQRAAALMQEAGDLLGMIPQLLDRTEELKTSAESVGKETDTLRKEIAALRIEVQQMKAEREEMADSLTAADERDLKLANEAVSKLRHPERRSAFWREGAAPVAESASLPPVPSRTSPGSEWPTDDTASPARQLEGGLRAPLRRRERTPRSARPRRRSLPIGLSLRIRGASPPPEHRVERIAPRARAPIERQDVLHPPASAK